eukprot:gnl/Trimastix_PCT/1798.p1 GENE.gnl/Trimastix_PCT/1798~~gnl/Trimastix_PCT/1798.p1  ORF type:complete len:826 (+),score=189.20 gnl/Trimastix_PCT/1798:69-2480(+)
MDTDPDNPPPSPFVRAPKLDLPVLALLQSHVSDAGHAIDYLLTKQANALHIDATTQPERYESIRKQIVHDVLCEMLPELQPLSDETLTVFTELYRSKIYSPPANSAKSAIQITADLILEEERQPIPKPPRNLKKFAGWLFRNKVFPPLGWVPEYFRRGGLPRRIVGDLLAGLTVGVLLVPQGMAYAMLAGLDPVYGLYSAFFPLLIYALFGTSRQLSVAPVAMVSMLMATALKDQGIAAGTSAYVQGAIVMAFANGIVQLILGIFQLGFVVNFMSHPVMSGFTSGAAIMIGLSQLKHILGVDIPRSEAFYEILVHAFQKATEWHGPTIGIGLAAIAIILVCKYWHRLIPGPILVVILGIALSYGLDLQHTLGIKIIGEIPSGLPAPAAPPLTWTLFSKFLVNAIAMSLVGFMESIAVAKNMAAKFSYDVDASQELVAIGLTNVVSSFFHCFPVTGGFSRTAVNAAAGAASQFASLVSALIVLLSLYLLTNVFYYLPKCILGAIIISAILGLLEFSEMMRCWREKKRDFLAWVVAFVLTMVIGIELGILIAIAVSLVLVLLRSAYPHTVPLGRIPHTTIFRNLHRFPHAEVSPHVLVFRMDASLYFANTAFLRSKVDQLRKERVLWLQAQQDQPWTGEPSTVPPLHAVVMDASGLNDVDSAGAHALLSLARDLAKEEVLFLMASVKGPVRDTLRVCRCLPQLGPENVLFATTHQAVLYAETRRDSSDWTRWLPPQASKVRCPGCCEAPRGWIAKCRRCCGAGDGPATKPTSVSMSANATDEAASEMSSMSATQANALEAGGSPV